MSELTTQLGTSENDILSRISAARKGGAEPVQEPTEETEPVDLSDDTDENPSNDIEVESQELETEIEEDEESQQETEETEDLDDLFYIDLDGEEITSEQIREWKNGSMMQSDYTRKTTEIANERKELEQEKQSIQEMKSKLSEQTATLEVLLGEETLSSEELTELREDDPDAYIRYIERQQKIKSTLEQAKQNTQPSFDVDKERQKLWSNNPQWLDGDKPTKAFQDDMNVMNQYASKIGITDTSNFNAAMFQMLLDGAKYQDAKSKTDVIKKKVRKAPVTTKPKQNVDGQMSELKKAQERFKKNPTDRNAIELRKIKRKLATG